VIPSGAFFDLREIAIRANRAAGGCPLLAVELPAMSAFDQVLVGASLGRVNLAKSPFCRSHLLPLVFRGLLDMIDDDSFQRL
jgi:hypothetical protein